MKKFKKVLFIIFEAIISPFTLLLRANVVPNPNKVVKLWLVFLISAAIVALIVLYSYREVIFRWWNIWIKVLLFQLYFPYS